MAGDLLASRYVQLEMKGSAAVKKGLQAIRDELNRAKQTGVNLAKALANGTYQKAARDMASLNAEYAKMKQSARLADLIAQHGKFNGSLTYMQERMAGVTRTATWGFGIATAATMGWVRSGMAGTVEAYQMDWAFTRLSRGIAGVFKPTIDSVIHGIERAANWFENLSGEQQANLRKTILWTAGVMGGVVALNLLASAAKSAWSALVMVTSPIGAIIAGVGLMAGGIALAIHDLDKMRTPGKILDDLRDSISNPTPVQRARKENTWRVMLGDDEALKKLAAAGDQSAKRTMEFRGLKPDKSNADHVTPFVPGFGELGSGWDEAANQVLKIADPMDKLRSSVDGLNETLKDMQGGPGLKVDGRSIFPAWLGGLRDG